MSTENKGAETATEHLSDPAGIKFLFSLNSIILFLPCKDNEKSAHARKGRKFF